MKTPLIVAVCLFVLSISLHADTASVNLLWESTTFRQANRDLAQSVATLHNRTIVGEVLGRADNSGTDVAVKAFNATTGHLIWDDEFEGAAVEVLAQHGTAIAVALVPRQSDGKNLQIRAYDLRDGRILWTTLERLDSPQRALQANGRLAVVGYDSLGFDPLVGRILTIDLATGTPLWSIAIQQPYSIPLQDTIFWDIDDAGHHVVA